MSSSKAADDDEPMWLQLSGALVPGRDGKMHRTTSRNRSRVSIGAGFDVETANSIESCRNSACREQLGGQTKVPDLVVLRVLSPLNVSIRT